MSLPVAVGLIINAVGLIVTIGAGGRVLGRIETLLSAMAERLDVMFARQEQIAGRVHDHGNALVRLEERIDGLTDRVAILEDTDRQRRAD